MRYLIVIVLAFCLNLKSEEKLDSIFNEVPEKLNTFEFKFPEYKLDFLENGTKLYLVPDNSQMITNIRLLLGDNKLFANSKTGVAELTTSMMLKGTQKKKANEISEIIDFYGANVSFTNNEDYIVLNISVLNKYLKEVLNIIDEVIFETKFNKDELKKLKKQYIASISAEKTDPNALASKLSKRIIYGKEHFYSKFPLEKDIENIELEDIIKFKKNLFNSNNASLGIYGYYTKSDLESIYKIFGKLEKIENEKTNSISRIEYKPGVYFIEREGSVQSSIRIVSPAPSYSDKDYEKLQFVSNIIGSGFIGKLFKILREKYSYTYSPSANITSRMNENYFTANADVKAEVTDSALTVMFEIFNDIIENGISEDELEDVKNYRIGNYYMSFENSDYTISLIQNSEFKGKRAKQLESFDSRIKSINQSDIKMMAKEYLDRNKLSIVVVGPKSVKEKLAKFGNVIEHDKNIKELSDFAKVNMDYDDIFEEFLESIGGDDIFEDIKTLKVAGNIKLNFNGQEVEGEYLEIMDSYKLKYSMQDIKINKQETISKNGKNYIKINEQINEEEISLFDKYSNTYFNFTKLDEKECKFNVLGKRDGRIYLELKTDSETRVYQFDENNYRLREYNSTQNTQMGLIQVNVVYENYEKIGEYFFPRTIKMNSNMFNSEMNLGYEVNPKLEKSVFEF